MSDDDEDEVVDEISVFLSHELEDQLMIYQYPLVPSSTEGAVGDVLKSKVKPENQHVELEFSLDTKSINYDRSHGEQIAISLENEDEDRPVFPQKMMDRMVFNSSKSLNSQDSYCVGVVKGNELHLTPIKSVLSLRPSLNHLEPESFQNQQGKEELEKVRVQFARSESQRAKQIREASYMTYAKRIAEEKWFNTEYHYAGSSRAANLRANLLSSSTGDVELSTDGYIDIVAPVPVAERSIAAAEPSGPLSLNYLRQLPPADRVKILLKEVKTVSLSQLVWVCGGAESEAIAVFAAQDAGVLVRGNWVLRSELLFPRNTFSPHNGIPADAMVRARDYILYQLNKEESVERKRLAEIVHLPAEELKDIMSQVAVVRNNRLWTFRLPTDNDFIAKYPHIVEREERLWAARYERLCEELEGQKSTSPVKASRRRKDSSRSSGGEEDVPKASRRKRTTSNSKPAKPASPTKQPPARMHGVRAAVKVEPLDAPVAPVNNSTPPPQSSQVS